MLQIFGIEAARHILYSEMFNVMVSSNDANRGVLIKGISIKDLNAYSLYPVPNCSFEYGWHTRIQGPDPNKCYWMSNVIEYSEMLELDVDCDSINFTIFAILCSCKNIFFYYL